MAVRLYPTTCRTPRCGQPRKKPGFYCEYCYSIRLITYNELGDINYDSKSWKAVRSRVLRSAHRCALCPAVPKVADHYPLSRRELWAHGLPNIDDVSRLRPLCKRCHARYTATQFGGLADHRQKPVSPAQREWERWTQRRSEER
ncbi:MAG: hypothetical protein IRZ03_17950 [Acidobacterium ailaaui]|nr:hypothetical protein [Pseudacidobacterium ailaaui]